ncbi:MAG: hypothetical protein KAS67_03550 [Thermoplasmata archaeon]|nr:hypothetical protein [Thermoplasmata archaeon]
MRILLDTNIFIYREDDKVLNDSLQKLLSNLNKLKVELLVHPFSVDEIESDRDEKRRRIMSSKVQAYSILDSPPNPEKDAIFLESLIKPIEVDDYILYSVLKNAVDFLITEDRGIHKKSIKYNIDGRTFLIDEAVVFFDSYFQKTQVISPPALKDEYVYNLDLNDSIFDKLKVDYEEFEDWFNKISKEGRKCWVHYREDDSIGALLIYKIENEGFPNFNPPLAKKTRLKINTFIVTHIGHKIGELFIKLSVDLCLQNNISEIYLTHFTEENDKLVQLITEYGLNKIAENERGEDIFLKKLIADEDWKKYDKIELAKKYYPSFYDGIEVRKFIVPILPEYHNKLFTDFKGRQTTILEHSGDFIVEGNTIKKAYLTHSRITKMQTGDLLLFYRSQDLGKITSIGVIESVIDDLTDVTDIMRVVGKRTVYSKEEIETFLSTTAKVILFLHMFHLKNPLDLEELIDEKVILGAPQTIGEISDENYQKIRKLGDIDEDFTIN